MIRIRQKTGFATFVAVLTLSCGYAAVPTIGSGVNAGSNDTRLNPGVPAAIYGTNLGTNVATGITVNVGSSAIGTGPTAVTVTVPGNGTSMPFSINLVAYAPAFFENTAPPSPIFAGHSGLTPLRAGSKARRPGIVTDLVQLGLAGQGHQLRRAIR